MKRLLVLLVLSGCGPQECQSTCEGEGGSVQMTEPVCEDVQHCTKNIGSMTCRTRRECSQHWYCQLPAEAN